MREPLFLVLAEVVAVHTDQIQRDGGHTGVRDFGLLESALAQPEASCAGEWLHQDLYGMAAAYAYHLCQNQPFVDGNKRTALACALVFLELNRVTLVDPKGVLRGAMLRIASSKMGKQELRALFQKLSEK